MLLKLIGSIVPLRVTTRDEGLGLDVTQHGEEAYAQDEGAILVLPEVATPSAAPAVARLEPEGGRA